VIALAIDILKSLGLQDLTLWVNSVGDLQDRQHYRQALIDYLTPFTAELDADSQDRLSRNPLRILDSKDPRTHEIVADAPQLLDYLRPDSQRHFQQMLAQLELLGIPYQVDHRLVRGLDYYTHTAFEIQSPHLGAQSTLCGGGRYDGLVKELGGPDTPAVGWAMGLERLIVLLQKVYPETVGSRPIVDVYVVSRGEAAATQALPIAQQLRQAGLTTEQDLSGSAFAKQFKRASRSGATWAVTLGDAEAASHTVQVKHLPTGDQQTLSQSDLVAYLRTDRPR
jgi:histidyl-tRNA synthetase